MFIIQRSQGYNYNATHQIMSRPIGTHRQLLILPKHSLCDMDMLKFYFISTGIHFPPMYTSIPFEARTSSHVAIHLACTMQACSLTHESQRLHSNCGTASSPSPYLYTGTAYPKKASLCGDSELSKDLLSPTPSRMWRKRAGDADNHAKRRLETSL